MITKRYRAWVEAVTLALWLACLSAAGAQAPAGSTPVAQSVLGGAMRSGLLEVGLPLMRSFGPKEYGEIGRAHV